MRTPAVAAKLTRSPPGQFVDAVLRGIGQVFLQNNPLTGALILLGIFLSSYRSGLYALLGTVVATVTALVISAPRESVGQGLYGFNGTLTAIDLSFYIERQERLIAYVVLACAVSAVLTAGIQNFLSFAHVPSLTAAFVATTWVFLAALHQFPHLAPSPALLELPHLPAQAGGGGGSLTPADLLSGFLNGFSQVFLQSGLWTGVAFLVGILVNSRISAAAAAVGSLIGLGTGWALGLPATALRDGLSGYNSVLTVIALGGLYYALSYRSALLAAVGGIAAVVVYGTFATILSPVGLPILTAPFVVTTWVFVLAATSLTRLRTVDPAEVTTPEGNLSSDSRRGTRSGSDARDSGSPGAGDR
ncbi:urea transporter [Geodermatophilus sp. TF02-6]|uniref:urea transporter n=1 Tax=Geodermatophilus sp. TF02-6 TaxID=2250575 RepID=UPI000DEBD85D|nr:urea transporter [Geodermatophilus sp. TF02-6]RBY83790.1 urea transporter [Geodermatophilus sp. TF02-6]